MRTRSTFSINFWLNTSRMVDGKAKIYARITIDSKRTNLSLKYTIDIKLWDKKLSRLKDKTSEAQEINNYLKEVELELFRCYRELKGSNDHVSVDMVKARYFGDDMNRKSLTELFKYHNLHCEHLLCAATMRHYKTTQKYLLQYLKSAYKKNDVALIELNHSFVVGFESFLRGLPVNHGQGYLSNNTAVKHIQRLKKMIGMALDNEWIERNPFQRFKSKFEKRERGYLNANELSRIAKFETKITRLEIVKDLFLFSCFTGIAYCDLVVLSTNNLILGIDGKLWINTKRFKTKNSFRLPLLEPAHNIIKKYQDQPNKSTDKLLPKLSNQKLNSYLKEIAHACTIKKNLTFHMARHTFATTVMLSNGVPIETVSKVLGHTQLATTQIYARVLDKKISEDMGGLFEKLTLTL